MKKIIFKICLLTLFLGLGVLFSLNTTQAANKSYYGKSGWGDYDEKTNSYKMKQDQTITIKDIKKLGNKDYPCIVTRGWNLKINVKGKNKFQASAIKDSGKINALVKVTKNKDKPSKKSKVEIIGDSPSSSTFSANETENTWRNNHLKLVHATPSCGASITVKNIGFSYMKSQYSGAVIKAFGSSLTVNNCTFDHCYLTTPKSNDDDTKDFGGGAIASYTTSTIIQSCSFTNCWCVSGDGEEKGGAIYAPKGTSLIIGANTTFKSCITRAKRWVTGGSYDQSWRGIRGGTYNGANYASKHDCNGGAVHAGTSTVTIGACIFEGNIAADAGGALHVVGSSSNPSKLFIGTGGQTVTFKNNECSWFPEYSSTGTWTGGGALNTRFCHVFIGKILDSSNTVMTNVNNMSSAVTFDGNLSYTTGGALYLNAGGQGVGKSYICANFTNNHSSYGGAICANKGKGDSYSLLALCKSNFSYNKAHYLVDSAANGVGKSTGYARYGTNHDSKDYQPYGGAIFSTQQLRIKGATNQTAPTNYFYNNSTIYRSDASGNTNGGAIYLNNNNLDNYIDKVKIGNVDNANYANTSKNGAGVALSAGSYLAIWNNTSISNNNADYIGGGVYLGSNSTLAMSAAQIKNNTSQYGGGICNNGGTIFLNSQWSSITNNTASVNGGGIYNTTNASLQINAPAEISSNQANKGGGTYNKNSTILIYSNKANIDGYATRINSNNATSNGGGFYNESGSIRLVDANVKKAHNVNIINNKSDYGAGIYNENGASITQESNLIKLNCYNNTRDEKTNNLAEIFNKGTFRLINANIGSKDNEVVSLNNKGTFNIAPPGNVDFNSKISSNNNLGTIVNDKDFVVSTITGQTTVSNNNENGTGIYNGQNGLLNFSNISDKFIIKASTENNFPKYGIYNNSTKTDNIIKANIGVEKASFDEGIYNNGNIKEYVGRVQHCSKHGITNKNNIANINNSTIINNGASDINGGGLFADTQSSTTFSTNNTIENNTASKGGGIYANETSKVYLGDEGLERNKSENTTSNSLINNTGSGANIYVEEKGYVRDLSTYHTVDNDNNSVYIDYCYKATVSDSDRAQYHIGYNTYFDRNSEYKPFVFVGYGNYIDVDYKLADTVKINGENISNLAQIYVKSIDCVYNPIYGQDSIAGRIIANQNIQNTSDSFDINYINDGNTRFLHYKTNGNKGLTTRYSYTLSNKGHNKLFTLRGYYNGESAITNSNEELNQNIDTDNLSCNNKNKFRQVYLTETHNVKYYPHTSSKRRALTQAQLNSVTGIDNIPNAEIETASYNNEGINYSYQYAVVKKYWCEDLKIASTVLKSDFGVFDKKESWATVNEDKVYSIYDNNNDNDYYTEEEDISLFAIWGESKTMLVSHYLMNQDGNYDADSVYTSFAKFSAPEGENVWYGGLFGIPEYQGSYPYKPIAAYTNHEGFESWHQLSLIKATETLDENFIKENLLDNNLIKNNISEYSYCEIIAPNNAQNSTPIVKIFYKREKYTVSVEADSGFNAISMINPYVYNISYNPESAGHRPTATRMRTNYDTESESQYKPIYGANDDTHARFNLKKDHTYKFNIQFSSEVGIYNSGPNLYHGDMVIDSLNNYNESNNSIEFEYTPYEDGEYYFGSTEYNTDGQIFGVPSFTGTVFVYNSELQNALSQSQNSLPSNLNKQTRYYYAIDESETRDLSYIGLEGSIFNAGGAGWQNRVDGIYKNNNDETYTKLDISNGKLNNDTVFARVSDALPQYGDVEYKIISKVNANSLKIYHNLEKQSADQSNIPDVQFKTDTITNYGMVKVGDLRELINNYSDYIDNSKTEFYYMIDTTHVLSFNTLNNLDDNLYLPTNSSGYNRLNIRYYRKTFTIKAIPGENASSATVSTDSWTHQSRSQTSVTEKYFLQENNPFGLPAEEFKTIYLDGQIKDGYDGRWSYQSVCPYNNYGDLLNYTNTRFKILGNHDVTFTLNAGIIRNITINHYLQDTNGDYILQEDKTQHITNSSLTGLKPDDYKDSSLEYKSDGVKYKYLDYATYLGETYNNTANTISFITTDKDVQISLFYSRKVIPVHIYANENIESISASSNSLQKTKDGEYIVKYKDVEDENARNNGKELDVINAYFGEKINLLSIIPDAPNDYYSLSFGGWDDGAYTFDSEHLENATIDYVYTVEATPVKHISAWAKLDPNKWHIRYHKNYKDDEEVCGHDSEEDNPNKYHMIYDTSPSMSSDFIDWPEAEDILCYDDGHVIKTATVAGKAYNGGSSYKLVKWHTKDGTEFDFGDTISRLDSEGEPESWYDPSTRTIDLYAKWKYNGPKINIYTEDVYLEVGTEITPDKILDKIHVSDGHGHVLSNEESHLGIVKIEVEKENQNQFKYPDGLDLISDTNLDENDIENYITSDSAKTYLITIRAYDEIDGKDVETTKTYKVIIYENILSKLYIRAIDKDMLPSLPINSIWREQQNYARLIKSLNKGNSGDFVKDNQEAKYIYAFNASDMEEIKSKIKNNGYKYKDVIKEDNIKKQPHDEE